MTRKFRRLLRTAMTFLTVFFAAATVSFAAPPSGFDSYKSNIPHGNVTTITYHSKTTGTDRKAMVYTPPGYSTGQKYNVLYLLHGIGGDHTEWYNGGSPNVILDNLYAEKKLSPMIVIMPNGRAMADDRAVGDIYSADKVAAFENFQYDLLNDLIPYVEAHYPVLTNRVNRAIGGLSMGGGQALNFGLKYMDYFAYAGGFSPAPNTYSPGIMVPNPSEAASKMKVIWIGCGEQDGLYSTAQGVHNYLAQKNVPHTWYSASGNHDFTFWKDSLYQYSQLIFKDIDNPEYKLGDINSDGQIDALDFVAIKKHLLGQETITSTKLADVDASGTIDAIDFALMKQYLLGTIAVFPAS
ncbi:enterochelin esterase-like enzyme [Ruminiclostridium sufflavum DSM 19573]|uniref:cellulase n=1 Tax=Ruminiclostridium sufflavum DSM 19573 TaxID=1121337 RepID=A0A318XM77_9FIRM|nr:alpha/beta hydrolase-fold protein [Ruminiclostridium sufflavum]PYG87658.1 enterochelin esterase-like enzyme [Ruminiclostridium sufflavum DSM 19573]